MWKIYIFFLILGAFLYNKNIYIKYRRKLQIYATILRIYQAIK